MAALLPVRILGHPLARAVLQRAGVQPGERHPLSPAAMRIERSRSRRGAETAEQTAVTLWFGEGPQLPGPGSSRSPWRGVAGLGATLVGAAALAAATTLAADREQRRRIAAARPVATINAAGEPPAS